MSSVLETQALYTPAVLTALVRNFDHDAVTIRKRITEFLQFEPDGFYRAAIGILEKDMDSRAAQYLIALLVHGGLLFRALCDPALDRARATELARQASHGDSAVPVKLARELADVSSSDSSLPAGMAERLLEIVDKVSEGRHILPSLMRILRNNNPYLRSKAVLMIGRSGASVNWLEKRLQESDTRVRANAIEALWGTDSEAARQLFQWAARDTNNRVVGNALMGLYRLGECSVLPELVKMASHNTPAFRRTAAWAMGQTGDARFSEILGRMIADSNANVRRSAFSAVGQIRTAVAEAAKTEEWQVAATVGGRNRRGGERRVSVSIAGRDEKEAPRILPVQFQLSEDGQPVWSYRVAEKMSPGPMTVAFVRPREMSHGGAGAVGSLKWKRSTDLWSVVAYSGADTPERPAELELPSFIANAAQAERALRETPKRGDCTGFWTAIRRAVGSGESSKSGPRHMIVLAPGDVGGNPNDGLAAALRTSRTSFQAISGAGNTALRTFCEQVGGHFVGVDGAPGIEEAVSLAYLSLLARYEIHYEPVSPEATSLKVRVQTPAGWGETVVAL